MNGVEAAMTWLTPAVLFCVLNVVVGIIFMASRSRPQTNQNTHEQEQHPSIFERVKSINLSRYRSEEPDDMAGTSEVAAEKRAEDRLPETSRAGGEDEEVDAKADDFINRFRQQLKLQRLDSILRYKEMLGR